MARPGSPVVATQWPAAFPSVLSAERVPWRAEFSSRLGPDFALCGFRRFLRQKASRSSPPGVAAKPLVFENGIPVGHPGKVIANRPGPAAFTCAPARLLADLLVMFKQIFE